MKKNVKHIFSSRQARYGSNALLLTIAFIGILVVINFLGYKNTRRWDLTADQANTLSKQSADIVKSLKSTVTAEAFYTPRMPSDAARKLLDSYKYASQGKFDYKFIDPEAEPAAAKKDGVSRDGTIVLGMDGRLEQVGFPGEQDISSALVRLSNPGKRAVYFLTGHGEFDISSSSDNPNLYTTTATTLANKNYTVNPLNLITTPAIPADALALVIAGPRKPFTQPEIDLLRSYVAKGGSLVVLSEPRPFTDFGDQKDLLADYLASDWGIKLDEDLIVDPTVNPPTVTAADKYEQHPVTKKMQGVVTVFPTARSISHTAVPQNVSITDLIRTSANVWGETDYKKISDNTFTSNPTQTMPGPLTVVAVATNATNKARLFVAGDADFASETYFQRYGNGDLMVNAIDWAAAQDNLINLTPKEPVQRMMLPPQQYTLGLVFFASVFLIPGFVLLSGILTWNLRRRNA
jgi:ABC-type uncharacterized transport system involved in gliding motility auxiliary subunit